MDMRSSRREAAVHDEGLARDRDQEAYEERQRRVDVYRQFVEAHGRLGEDFAAVLAGKAKAPAVNAIDQAARERQVSAFPTCTQCGRACEPGKPDEAPLCSGCRHRVGPPRRLRRRPLCSRCQQHPAVDPAQVRTGRLDLCNDCNQYLRSRRRRITKSQEAVPASQKELSDDDCDRRRAVVG